MNSVSPPTKIKLNRAERVLELTWPDLEQVTISARQLRCDCRCAGCVDEVTGQKILDVRGVLSEVAVNHIDMIGNYALKFHFSDGHDTGVFTWNHLHELSHQVLSPDQSS